MVLVILSASECVGGAGWCGRWGAAGTRTGEGKGTGMEEEGTQGREEVRGAVSFHPPTAASLATPAHCRVQRVPPCHVSCEGRPACAVLCCTAEDSWA